MPTIALPFDITDIVEPKLASMIGGALGLASTGLYVGFLKKTADVTPILPFGLAEWGMIALPTLAGMAFVTRNMSALYADRSTAFLFTTVWAVSAFGMHRYLGGVGYASETYVTLCVVFGALCTAAATLPALFCGIAVWQMEILLRNVGLNL